MDQLGDASTSRARILAAAEDLLGKKSAQFVHIRDVAQLAGVSPALIMRYFRSKDELVFEALMRRIAARDQVAFEDFAKHNPHPEIDHLARLCFQLDAGADAHATRDLFSMAFWWTEADEAQVGHFLRARRDMCKAIVTATLALRDAAPEPTVDLCVDTIFCIYAGVLREALVHREAPDAAAERFTRMARMAIDGLRHKAAHGA